LDLAGGELVGDKPKSDFSTLSVWRKTYQNIKEKVFVAEWKGDLSIQLDDIIALIHPKTGIFKCKMGLADYGDMGAGIVDILRSKGIPVDGLFFNSKEETTGKNYKNAMFEHFVFELRNERVRYPLIVNPEYSKKIDFSRVDNSIRIIRKHFDEWCAIEKHRGIGVNCKILAPKDLHDDGCMSDVLCVWGADKGGKSGMNRGSYKIPSGVKARSLFSGSRLGSSQQKKPFQNL